MIYGTRVILPDGSSGADGEGARFQLSNASRAVDALTFNRIPAVGFDSLTQFQRGRVEEVTERLAGWYLEYGELLSSPVTGYAINGVSAQYGAGPGVTVQNGVTIPRELLALLEQTGLCCRRLG